MKIDLSYNGSCITITATHPLHGIVAEGVGTNLETAVKSLVSHFAEMQKRTIEALNESGIIRYVQGVESESVS